MYTSYTGFGQGTLNISVHLQFSLLNSQLGGSLIDRLLF